MTDTSQEIEDKVWEMMQEKTSFQRLQMACRMFDTGRELILSSLDSNLMEAQRRGEVFVRTYGEDFSREELKRIAKNLNRVVL